MNVPIGKSQRQPADRRFRFAQTGKHQSRVVVLLSLPIFQLVARDALPTFLRLGLSMPTFSI